MAFQDVWSVTDADKVVSYHLQYQRGLSIQDNIDAVHREIVYIFGGTPLDISLNSNNSVGTQLSVYGQHLDDRAVFDVCQELLKGKIDDGSADFASTASIIFDWVYMQAVLEKFNDNIDLTPFTHFTDVKATTGKIYSGARAVAAMKLLQKTGKMDLLSDFEQFSIWHVNNVLDVRDTPEVVEDYRIISNYADHISIISRLPKNILSVVADKYNMQLWHDAGRYILYAGLFNQEWIHDFIA